MGYQIRHRLLQLAVLGLVVWLGDCRPSQASQITSLYVGGTYTSSPPLTYTFRGGYDGVAYLLTLYGNPASAIGRDAEARLHAAIWQVLYQGDTYQDSNSTIQPLFNYVRGSNADSYYDTYLNGVTHGLTDPNLWSTDTLSKILWMSPSNDPLISPNHPSNGYIYQALFTLAQEPSNLANTPEPSSLAIAGLGALGLIIYTRHRGKSTVA
jgi:hypothetical protein